MRIHCVNSPQRALGLLIIEAYYKFCRCVIALLVNSRDQSRTWASVVGIRGGRSGSGKVKGKISSSTRGKLVEICCEWDDADWSKGLLVT